MVRCKMMLTEITEVHWSKEARRVKFSPQYDTTIPEDQRFAKASPCGEFWMQIDNPAALAQLEIGKQYYFDLSPVPAPAPQ